MLTKLYYKKFKHPPTMSATLALVFVVLSILSLVLASSFQFILNFQAQQAIINQQQELAAQKAAEEVSRVIQQVFTTLEISGEIGQPSSSIDQERQRLLFSILELQPSFQEVAWLNQQGREVTRVSRLQIFQSSDLEEWTESELYRQVAQNQRYVSPLYSDEQTDNPMVTVAVPIKNVVGVFEGAVIAELNVHFVWDIVSSLQVGETGLVYVVDRRGQLIAFQDTARVKENVSYLSDVAEFVNNDSSSEGGVADAAIGIQGTYVLGTYVSLKQPAWAVMVEVPLIEAYWPLIINLAFLVSSTLVVALLAALTGLHLARRLAEPVLDLTETAVHIAAGQLDLQAPLTGTAEMNRLAVAFNSMTTQLRESIHLLEDRVSQRTYELAQAKDAAEEANKQTRLALCETKILFQAVQSILAASGLSDICQKLITYFNQLVKADQMILCLVDHDQREIILWVEQGQTKPVDDIITYETWQRVFSHILLDSTHPLRSNRGTAEFEKIISYLPHHDLWSINAVIIVPFVTKGEVIGTITALSRQPEIFFSQHDVDLLMALTTQASTAIENVRLYTLAQQELKERKRAEAALQTANQELAKLNRNKDKFFSILAHDLKGPFAPLLSTSTVLAKSAQFLPPVKIKEMSQHIHRSVTKLHELLENLLQWSRIQMGRAEFRPGKIEVSSIVDQNIQLMSETALRKSITLRNLLPRGVFIQADEYMFDTIIRNLISNALKFTPPGGQVTVSISAELSNHHPNEMVEISVSDTGVGISAADIDKLFKVERHHTTIGTAQETGTGLGLVLCYEMVNQHGGQIQCQSEIGQGTTFFFTMPRDVATPVGLLQSAVAGDAALVEPIDSTTAVTFITPPPVEMTDLWDMALRGNMRGVQEQAYRLEKLDARYKPFAHELHQLAENFDEQKILALMKQYMND